MYLIIDECGEITHTEDLTIGDMTNCSDGYITIVDISESNKPKELNDGEWFEVECA